MKNKNTWAIVLIGIGVLSLLKNTGWFDGEIFLFIVSLGFCAGYLFTGGRSRRGSVGLLIPACIIFAVAAFSTLESNINLYNLDGTLFFLFLGTAFMAVYLIHTMWIRESSRGERIWPAITGACIYAFGGFVFLVEYANWEYAKPILENLWPIGLIAAGVIIIASSFFRGRKSK
jgi:CDP-diglyceride synthetase